MADSTNRRDFIKGALVTGIGLGTGAVGSAAPALDGSGKQTAGHQLPAAPASYRTAAGFSAPPLERLRIAFVGTGLQGGSHVQNFLRIDKVDIVALCDIDELRAREVQGWITEAGKPAPDLYTRGETDYKRLCERGDIDLVLNAPPWRWHVPICVEAMESGHHVAVEVPAAYTLDGCWQLVETAERTERHCVMLENCCYGRSELMVLRMVKAGLLGEILHGESAYIHDLRAIKFSDANEGLWRLEHSARRNGNLYPTHGLGPVAQCMDINRGDRFDYLVSMSSPARGLNLYAREHLDAGDPRRHRNYILGDMNSSLIKTKLGRTILLQHDTTSPRVYSRLDLVQGTRGTFAGFPDRIHIEGRSDAHRWEEMEHYREEWDHPLWRQLEKEAAGAGHGGMDYLEDFRLVECLLNGAPTDLDVYDAAAWSAPCELSERSVAQRSQAVDFPDFTRGRWERRQPFTDLT